MEARNLETTNLHGSKRLIPVLAKKHIRDNAFPFLADAHFCNVLQRRIKCQPGFNVMIQQRHYRLY